MNTERLIRLLETLEEAQESEEALKRFNMEDWGRGTSATCLTAACAAGTYVVHERHQPDFELGFLACDCVSCQDLRHSGKAVGLDIVNIHNPMALDHSGRVLARHFDIDHLQMSRLFMPSNYPEESCDIEPRHVASRVVALLETTSGGRKALEEHRTAGTRPAPRAEHTKEAVKS